LPIEAVFSYELVLPTLK